MPNPKYTDFTDFILGVTAEIWEGRGIERLKQHYSDDIIVRSPSGVVVGNDAVIGATRETLAEFPDRRLLGEDVIWEQTGINSWLSSHRLFCTATHLGHGFFGAPTGKRLQYRVIADCHAEGCPINGWKINDEWLIRDFGAILRCLGKTAREFAEEWQARQQKAGKVVRFAGLRKCSSPVGPYVGSGINTQPATDYECVLQSVMVDDFSAIARHYDPACQLDLPSGFTGHGIGDAERFWLGLRSSFPSAVFNIEHRVGRTDSGQPVRVALRWSLDGGHDGFGMFGAPTNNPVHIMGISHAEFGPRGLKREFILIDEVSVWQQILADPTPTAADD